MAFLLKLSAFLVALGGIILGFTFWPEDVSAYDECRHLMDNTSAWLACINGTDIGTGGAKVIAIANIIGGLLSGLVLYAIGHVVDRVDALHQKLVGPQGQSVAGVPHDVPDGKDYLEGKST
ncbi:MAG: hypothetical protein WCY11_18925 [Novosphingobium sp.]